MMIAMSLFAMRFAIALLQSEFRSLYDSLQIALRCIDHASVHVRLYLQRVRL